MRDVDGSKGGGVQISRAEVALYGHGGGPMIVRRLGMALTNVEQARQVALEALEEGRHADSISANVVDARGEPKYARDEQGRSAYTAWLDTVFDRLYELERLASVTYRDLAIEIAEEERRTRRGIDSMPSIEVEPGEEEPALR